MLLRMGRKAPVHIVSKADSGWLMMSAGSRRACKFEGRLWFGKRKIMHI